MRRAHFYSLLALCLFLMSLLLPALELRILGSSATISGWFTVVFGLERAWEGLQSLFNGTDKVSWKFMLAAFGASFNLIFFVTPFALRNLQTSRMMLMGVGLCSAVGFFLGILTYVIFADMKIALQPGYYLWLLGYVVNVYAVFLALYETLRRD